MISIVIKIIIDNFSMVSLTDTDFTLRRSLSLREPLPLKKKKKCGSLQPPLPRYRQIHPPHDAANIKERSPSRGLSLSHTKLPDFIPLCLHLPPIHLSNIDTGVKAVEVEMEQK